MMACRGALWDTRIPRTRAVEYRAPQDSSTGIGKTKESEGGEGVEDTEMSDVWKAAVQSKKAARAADFELEDYWDHGDRFKERHKCPVAITLNIVSTIIVSRLLLIVD